jgi:hypothetical protein
VQAELDALAASIGMGKKSRAYGLVRSALAEREVQKVLETRWFYQPFSILSDKIILSIIDIPWLSDVVPR